MRDLDRQKVRLARRAFLGQSAAGVGAMALASLLQAADKQVEASVRQPLRYYHRNVENLRRLLSAMQLAEVTAPVAA